MTMTATTNANDLPIVNRACPPPWCELTAGHGWDSRDTLTGVEQRGHGATPGPSRAGTSACPSEPLKARPPTFMPVVIEVDRRVSSRVCWSWPRIRSTSCEHHGPTHSNAPQPASSGRCFMRAARAGRSLTPLPWPGCLRPGSALAEHALVTLTRTAVTKPVRSAARGSAGSGQDHLPRRCRRGRARRDCRRAR
jgi:hypothetical protein